MYEQALERLDREHIETMGALVKGVLGTGAAAAISYQPGNMTRYDCVFQRLSQAQPSYGRNEVAGQNGFVGETEQAILVSILNFRVCGTFRLLAAGEIWSTDYIQEKLSPAGYGGISYGDAVALRALFEAIRDS